MMTTRREFLQQLSAIGIIASGLGNIGCTRASKPWFVSACTNQKGQHFVAAFDIEGRVVNQVALPERGHDAIALPHKPGRAMIFARRPGTFALEVDFIKGRVVRELTAAEGLHFYGHGTYSKRHNTLITSENDFHSGIGKIVIRDANSYQELVRYDSGGIGPHEIALMPDGDTLVIANGGIKTHPDSPRKKLNLDSMRPNLAYLSLKTGELLDTFELDNKHLSIRHLAVSNKGKVVAGLQYQGEKTDLVPLAISHHGEASLSFLAAEESVWRQMNQYTASVCIDEGRQVAAISCPRADLLTYWSLKNNQFLTKERLADGAGLTFIDQLYATSGKGLLINTQVSNSEFQRKSAVFEQLKWDNHLTFIQSVSGD